MYRFYITLLLSSITILACNDHLKIESNNNPQGYADSQVVGLWKITAANSDFPYDWDGNGSPETDIYATWTDCLKNNSFQFFGDKTGIFQLNCNETHNGIWQIYNLRQLEYTPDGMSTEVEKFISMTSNQFKTTRTHTIPGGQTYTITKTWTRQ